MRCVGNGTDDRAYSSQPLRSNTAHTHARNTHPGHLYSQGGTHTRWLIKTLTQRHKETLTDSGVFKYRDTLKYRDMANMTHSTDTADPFK